MAPYFTGYVALGDSTSIGAAPLLFQNDDVRWPNEQGEDLSLRYPGIALINLASEGATIGDVFGEQLPQVEECDAGTLVTLTIGGNDLLSAFANKPRITLLEAIARDVAEAYEFLLDSVRRTRPRSLILLTTIYDPGDGTGHVPGILDGAGEMPLHIFAGLNDRIRTLVSGTPGTALADVHAHFLGHGANAPEPERWYWRQSPMEPNAVGAHEIRRVWRDAIYAANAEQ